jgi:hypothetical protein
MDGPPSVPSNPRNLLFAVTLKLGAPTYHDECYHTIGCLRMNQVSKRRGANDRAGSPFTPNTFSKQAQQDILGSSTSRGVL